MKQITIYILVFSIKVSAQYSEISCGYKVENNFKVDSILNHYKSKKSRASVITIPIIFHNVYFDESDFVSTQRILEQIDQLNNSFNGSDLLLKQLPFEFENVIGNMNVQFCLYDSIFNNENIGGIIRSKTNIKNIGLTKEELYLDNLGGSNTIMPRNVLNIWIANCNKLVAGYGTYPNQVPMYKDGVVIDPLFIGKNFTLNHQLGKILVHEIGHFFGLYHIWQSDSLNCNINDSILDTPSQLNPYFGNPKYPQFSCGFSNQFMNYMDYTNDSCACLFTVQQCERMRNVVTFFRPEFYLNDNSMCFINSKIQSNFNVLCNSNKLVISFPYSKLSISKFRIYNIMGELIRTFEINPTAENNIDISYLSNGLYFVSNGLICRKIVKQ